MKQGPTGLKGEIAPDRCVICGRPAKEGDRCGYHTGHFQPADLGERMAAARKQRAATIPSSSGPARIEAFLAEISDWLAEINAKLDTIAEHLEGPDFVASEDTVVAAKKGRPLGVPRGKR